MRLKKIKLAGFKSFVDPTTLEIRSPLVAVVGPNGCGKSNIIDAIRWVMGESSAKNLRGESMSDVIFNGSNTRKPVGQASIELIFDNTEGTLGGEYASYAEISIRRSATRDGQSSYFLNGTRCRRRDITEVFMGTGLGPRSYSIIEQGMISRVIEAKPEELRGFIEEAAGISLYRKRRQETETRMRHTRENLDRLADLQQELDKQLERLKRQSESAERYKLYKEEYDQLEVQLTTLRWQAWNMQLTEKTTLIRNQSMLLEEKQAKRAHLDLELEKYREIQIEKTDAWKSVQSRYYDLGAKIARLEQNLQHLREKEQTLQVDLTQAEQQYQENCQQVEQDKVSLDLVDQELLILNPEFETQKSLLEQTEAVLLNAEEAMRKSASQFESFQENATKTQRFAEVEKTKIEQLEKQSRDALHRITRLKEEQKHLSTEALEKNLEKLERELLEKELESTEGENRAEALITELTEKRASVTLHSKALNETRGLLQSLQGRSASLEALQQAALGKNHAALQNWLASLNLESSPRLGEDLQVEPGFEQAVETALGNALEAICVSGFEAVTSVITELSTGNAMFFDKSQHFIAVPSGKPQASLLVSKIKTSAPIQSLLANIYVVEELSEALKLRATLEYNESIITKRGDWLGRDWLKIFRGSEAHNGVLQRETELKEIVLKIEVLHEKIHELESQLSILNQNIIVLETERESLHRAQQTHSNVVKEISKAVSHERARLDHVRNRLAQLLEEMNEVTQTMTFAEEETALARMNLQTALDDMESFSNRRVTLLAERETLRELWQKAGHEAKSAKEKMHSLALKHQTLLTQQKATLQGLSRLEQQLALVIQRRSTVQTALQEIEAPQKEYRYSLEELLLEQSNVGNDLNRAKNELEVIEQELRSFDKQRNHCEQEALSVRTELEKLKMDWQGLEVRAQTVEEKLTELGVTADEVLKNMPSDAEESLWNEKLSQVGKRIERLGAINLAAIEEFQTESERKNYLDSQQKDLTEALETLENAIRKIDRETRARFKETFENVNEEFQKLFPRLFGGGHATLELVGDDLLEAGVTVMARPPGKRNSSIHLLSGGEKALTAVAMVFAIFQLNPAPFCLLDEVDAPLDDANVGRFCELVKHMSTSVQFIIVTHNKLAMEIAHDLVGVTMKEAGVSRLVSVDVEEAAALVAS